MRGACRLSAMINSPINRKMKSFNWGRKVSFLAWWSPLDLYRPHHQSSISRPSILLIQPFCHLSHLMPRRHRMRRNPRVLRLQVNSLLTQIKNYFTSSLSMSELILHHLRTDFTYECQLISHQRKSLSSHCIIISNIPFVWYIKKNKNSWKPIFTVAL